MPPSTTYFALATVTNRKLTRNTFAVVSISSCEISRCEPYKQSKQSRRCHAESPSLQSAFLLLADGCRRASKVVPACIAGEGFLGGGANVLRSGRLKQRIFVIVGNEEALPRIIARSPFIRISVGPVMRAVRCERTWSEEPLRALCPTLDRRRMSSSPGSAKSAHRQPPSRSVAAVSTARWR